MSERAASEIMFNKTELVSDLRTRLRMIPPPLTVVVVVLAAIVWFSNLIIALISPRWNVYAYLHHGTLEKLKSFDLRSFCRKWKGKLCCSNGQRDLQQEHGVKAVSRERQSEASVYFLSMTRADVLRWHLGAFVSMFSCCRCKGCQDYEVKHYKKIHHRNCYGIYVS